MTTTNSIIEKMSGYDLLSYVEERLSNIHNPELLQELLDEEEMPKSNQNRSSNKHSNRGFIAKLQIVSDKYDDAAEARRVYREANDNLMTTELIRPLTARALRRSTYFLGKDGWSSIDKKVMKALVAKEAETNTGAAALIAQWNEDKKGFHDALIEGAVDHARDEIRRILNGEEERHNIDLDEWTGYADDLLSEENERAKERALEMIMMNGELVQSIRRLIEATIVTHIDFRKKVDILRQSLKNLFSSNIHVNLKDYYGYSLLMDNYKQIYKYSDICRSGGGKKKRNHKTRKCKSKRCHKKSKMSKKSRRK
jgi:hypothetical protein